MHNVLKRRGSIASLVGNHPREQRLIARIESGVDAGAERRGLIEAMLVELQALAVANPRDASWRLYLGRLMMAAGDPLDARDELEAASALDPRDPRIAAHLAIWYEAALLAACGERVNIDLPPLAGPDLCADASRFADLDERLAPETLAARAAQWARVALRFRLPNDEQRFLSYFLHMARTHAFPAAAPGAELALLTRTT